jgi:hypothetical protein
MVDFVEQCRSEWRRLGVPDPLADEMAADLATDLSEAESEGVSAEELLGSGFFDPRSFAASWAAARGIIPAPPDRGNARRRPRILVALTAVAAIALLVAALLLATGQPTVSVVARTTRSTHSHVAVPAPGAFGTPGSSSSVVLHASAAAPVEWILLVFAIVALGLAVWLWSRWGRSQPPFAAA